MISAAKLEVFTEMSSDTLTGILLDQGYDTTDEPILFTKFKGINTRSATKLDFLYIVSYLDQSVTTGLADATIIVTYDTMTDKLDAEYADGREYIADR
jgi:hypothetical protein